jgi:hypothetical protein
MRGSDARRITMSYQFVCALTGVKFCQCLKNVGVQQSPWLTALYWHGRMAEVSCWTASCSMRGPLKSRGG